MHAHASLPTQSCITYLYAYTNMHCAVRGYIRLISIACMQVIITYLIGDDKIDDKRGHKQRN